MKTTRRELLLSVGCAATPSAQPIGEEETLRRLLLSADWSQSFSLAFTDRHGNRRVLDWMRMQDHQYFAGMLGTDEPPPPDNYWPKVCTVIYKCEEFAEAVEDAISEVWWYHFREEWPRDSPALLAGVEGLR